jgi:hypothetical protein
MSKDVSKLLFRTVLVLLFYFTISPGDKVHPYLVLHSPLQMQSNKLEGGGGRILLTQSELCRCLAQSWAFPRAAEKNHIQPVAAIIALLLIFFSSSSSQTRCPTFVFCISRRNILLGLFTIIPPQSLYLHTHIYSHIPSYVYIVKAKMRVNFVHRIESPERRIAMKTNNSRFALHLHILLAIHSVSVQVRQSRSGESESTFSFFPFLAGTFSIRCITKYGRSERLLEIVLCFFPAAQSPGWVWFSFSGRKHREKKRLLHCTQTS